MSRITPGTLWWKQNLNFNCENSCYWKFKMAAWQPSSFSRSLRFSFRTCILRPVQIHVGIFMTIHVPWVVSEEKYKEHKVNRQTTKKRTEKLTLWTRVNLKYPHFWHSKQTKYFTFSIWQHYWVNTFACQT